MRLAIMGAGSLGTILGAYITKAGYDIDLIDTYEEHIRALNDRGLTLSEPPTLSRRSTFMPYIQMTWKAFTT